MNFRLMIYMLTAALYVQLSTQCTVKNPDVVAAENLAKRVLGSQADSFVFERLDSDSSDCFTITGKDNKVIIAANNANSMAVGLNYYLKFYCNVSVSWYKDAEVLLPAVLPQVSDTITVTAAVPNRFFLNYCTFGYTMPWWKWEDWEHFIDWMALNGINMPLAITGQESIWYNVWTKLGLTDEQIRSYFTGPAHLPWHRMCNLDRWQGNLPMEWLESQAELQKLIVDRERELNMRPVLPGFAGHVPEALTSIYPNLKTSLVSEWGGFSDEYRCTYLSPTDSLFAVIQKEYLTEQTKLYGTDHIYGIDPFNEVDPPTWDADSLSQISANIYKSVAAVDSDAVWLQMAWFLYADYTHWTPERAKAFLTGVPQGKMMLLDYFCENTELWKMYDKFYGQPYIWCYLGNFGGNSFLAGPANMVKERIDDVFENGGNNLAGLGSTLEGLDLNPYMYEYVLDRAWNIPVTQADYVNNIADRRTGFVSENARKAWDILMNKIYVSSAICGCGTLTNARPALEGNGWWTTHTQIDYDNRDLMNAWELLVDIPDAKTDAYTFDIVNLGRQALGNYFTTVRDEFAAAYKSGDVSELKAKGDEMKEILSDITMLVSSHPTFSLRKWIDDARSFGTDSVSSDYYETNARTLVTIWGDSHSLTDYANRSWAELNDQYYAVRWNRFIDEVINCAESGRTFDADTFYNQMRDFEISWIDVKNNKINYLPLQSAKEIVPAICNKYSQRIK